MNFESIPVSDERARDLATAVRHLDMEYRALRHRFAERAGISTAELDVLAALPGESTMTPKRLAAVSHLTTSAMTALLDRLSAAGLLRRTPHPTDRRSVVVALTVPGERLVTDLYSRYVAKFEQLLANGGCAGSEVAVFTSQLGCVTGALASGTGEDELAATA